MIFQILKKLKESPSMMRKLKIFVVVGLVGFLITGALTIWAGITAFNYLASTASPLVQSPIPELVALPKFQLLNCWSKAQSLMAVQPWLERSAVDNLVHLKMACLEDRPVDLLPTIEGRAI